MDVFIDKARAISSGLIILDLYAYYKKPKISKYIEYWTIVEKMNQL